MQFIIDREDFRALSQSTQRELIELFAGKGVLQPKTTHYQKRISIRQPVDISEEQAKRLFHGLSDDHSRRLELFVHLSPLAGAVVMLPVVLGLTWGLVSKPLLGIASPWL